eukprot:5733464-Prymnesium_polylepis.1
MTFIAMSTVGVDRDIGRNQSKFDWIISSGGRHDGQYVQTIRRRYQCGNYGVHAVSAHEKTTHAFVRIERTNRAGGAVHGTRRYASGVTRHGHSSGIPGAVHARTNTTCVTHSSDS